MNKNYLLSISFSWQSDIWGHPDRLLYIGSIYVGGVELVVGDPDHPLAQWTGHLTTDADFGTDIEWFETEQEAKDALLTAALKGLENA